VADGKSLWVAWQSLLGSFRPVFTRPGWRRFVQWVTGMVLCLEEHFLTRTLVGSGLEAHWRALERFAEQGAWSRMAVECQTIRLVERERPVRWGGYRPVAVDDTKSHRTSAKVWGVCTFHESSARSPNRAETVRAHNWVILGDLLPDQPWWFLPHSSRLYFRRSQLPQGETFRTKLELAVEMLRQADAVSTAPLLGIFDGAYAQKSVIQPCLRPEAAERRIEILTRLRLDARLYAPLEETVERKRGRPRKWGRRLPAPKDHAQWEVPWEEGETFLYGRSRHFRAKRLECHWAVGGAEEPVSAFALEVEGFSKPWFLVASARELTTAQVAEAYAARYRQEDAFRDHKQLLGMEECRAWTKEPILRTFQVQMVAMTLLRLIQFRLESVGQWWPKTPWYLHKRHVSILDLRRVFWRHREEFSHVLQQPYELAKTRECLGFPHFQEARAA
jgi:hypothetical protein